MTSCASILGVGILDVEVIVEHTFGFVSRVKSCMNSCSRIDFQAEVGCTRPTYQPTSGGDYLAVSGVQDHQMSQLLAHLLAGEST